MQAMVLPLRSLDSVFPGGKVLLHPCPEACFEQLLRLSLVHFSSPHSGHGLRDQLWLSARRISCRLAQCNGSNSSSVYCRYKNKPYKIFSAGVEAAFFWSSIFLCFAVIAFGPITGVVAAGLIYGENTLLLHIFGDAHHWECILVHQSYQSGP